MRPPRALWRSLPAVVVVAIGLLLVLGGVPISEAGATSAPSYLALGDSITFGYVDYPPPELGSDPYANADNSVGYPSTVGTALGLQVVNAACPGETTSSMITMGAPDAGCASFRSSYPLHVAYDGLSQLAFAEAFLRGNRGTKLVTIGIGINDVFRAGSLCGGFDNSGCIQRQLPSTLDAVRSNLFDIVRTVRHAGYTDPIVLLTYYALEYADAATVNVIRALDATIEDVAATDSVLIADSFDAFSAAAAATHGDACAAGLFGRGPSSLGPCDVHANANGQHLLATVVEGAVRSSLRQRPA